MVKKCNMLRCSTPPMQLWRGESSREFENNIFLRHKYLSFQTSASGQCYEYVIIRPQPSTHPMPAKLKREKDFDKFHFCWTGRPVSRPPSFVNISWKKTQVDTHTAHSITPPLNMAGKKYIKNYIIIIPRKTPQTGKCWGEIRQVRKVKDVSQKRKCSGDINSQRRKQILQIDGGVKVRSLYLPLLQNVKK